MNNNRKRIINVFKKYTEENSEIEAVLKGEPLLTVLSIDSLAMIHLVNDLENEFEIRFDYETIEYVFETIESLEVFLSSESSKGMC